MGLKSEENCREKWLWKSKRKGNVKDNCKGWGKQKYNVTKKIYKKENC